MKERHQRILHILSKEGYLSPNALAQSLNVSRMTIHRDLDILAKKGMIKRVKGGATFSNYNESDPGWEAKHHLHQLAKEEIAQYAVEKFVRPHYRVFIESGSTARCILPYLAAYAPLDIYINCISLLKDLEIYASSNINFHIIPGMVHAENQTIIGTDAQKFLQSTTFDLCFLSATAVSLTGEFQDPDMEIIKVKEAVVKASKQVILLVNASKFGSQSQYKVYSPKDIHHLVCEQDIPPIFQSFLEKNHISLHIKP